MHLFGSYSTSVINWWLHESNVKCKIAVQHNIHYINRDLWHIFLHLAKQDCIGVGGGWYSVLLLLLLLC